MGFSVDPYKHQASSDWKNEAVEKDAELLRKFFGKSQEELEQASTAYKGEEYLLFNFIYAIRFLEYCFNEALKDTDTMLKVLVTIFAVEAIAPGEGKKEKFVRFFTQTLTEGDKICLLRAYVFSEPVSPGTAIPPFRHVMCKNCLADPEFQRETYTNGGCNTIGSGCDCIKWLQSRGIEPLDTFLKEILEKLYEMRCAVVHDVSPVFFVAHEEDSTLRDVFSGKGKFIHYRCGLGLNEYIDIVKRAFWVFFEGGCNLNSKRRP